MDHQSPPAPPSNSNIVAPPASTSRRRAAAEGPRSSASSRPRVVTDAVSVSVCSGTAAPVAGERGGTGSSARIKVGKASVLDGGSSGHSGPPRARPAPGSRSVGGASCPFAANAANGPTSVLAGVSTSCDRCAACPIWARSPRISLARARRVASFGPASWRTYWPTSSSSGSAQPEARHAATIRRESSAAVGQRASAAVVSALAIACSSSAGTATPASDKRGGVSLTIFKSSDTSLSLTNRRRPASSSQATTPPAQTSQRRSIGCPRACSGDM